MATVTNSKLFVHNQTNGYVYAPQYAGTVWPAGPWGGRSGLIQLTNDVVVSFNISAGGSNYSNPVITVGKPWAASTLEAQNTQVVSGANLYTVVFSGTSGTVAPTDVTGNNFTDGTATLKYAGKAAVITTTANGGAIQSGYTILQSGGSGYLTTPTVYISDSGGGTGTGAIMTASLNQFPQGSISPIVPGVVYLDSYTVIGQANGNLYASSINDPTIWTYGYIQVQNEPSGLVGIAKHLNYVVAFSQWSTQFYYDTGQVYPNNVLAPSTSYSFEVGCVSGTSIVQMEQSVIWVGQAKTTGTGVYMLNGVSPFKISNSFIDRILSNSNLSTTHAYIFKFNGHTFYVLTLHDLNLTIVYDIEEKEWYQWTMWAAGDADSGVSGIYAEQYFRPSYYASNYGPYQVYYLLDDDNGVVYTLSDTQYSDAGAPIYFRSVTDIHDAQTMKRKFFRRIEVVGDKVPATMKIRRTDDDYRTWSSYRSVNLNVNRPVIYQCGQSRRAAWEFLCTDNQPIRLESAEFDFDVGEIQEGQP